MSDKFPIMQVARESLLAPLQNPVSVLKAIGLVILLIIFGLILTLVVMFAVGFDAQTLQSTIENIQQGDVSGAGGLLGLGIGYLLMFLILMTGMSYIFNYWVRFAAFGSEGAKIQPFSKAVQAALVNMVKFLLIGILGLGILLVINFVLVQMGLAVGFMEQITITDPIEQFRAGFATSMITTVAYCFVYSLFSANLTQTAMGNDKEDLDHPHTIDFAVSLMIIYAVSVLPALLAALTGSVFLLVAVQFSLGLIVVFAIPAAHGIRYKFCVAKNSDSEVAA